MSTAPKVTMADIEDMIVDTSYTVLADGRTTICQLTLRNGFTVLGSSACVCAENFDEALGQKYSREKAVDQCWELGGLLLAERLYQENKSKATTFVDRLHAEWRENHERLGKLQAALAKPHPSITAKHLKMLQDQAVIMQDYDAILKMRLDDLSQG